MRDLETKISTQAEKDAKTIEDLTKALDRRLEEIAILDNDILGKQASLPLCFLSNRLFFSRISFLLFLRRPGRHIYDSDR